MCPSLEPCDVTRVISSRAIFFDQNSSEILSQSDELANDCTATRLSAEQESRHGVGLVPKTVGPSGASRADVKPSAMQLNEKLQEQGQYNLHTGAVDFGSIFIIMFGFALLLLLFEGGGSCVRVCVEVVVGDGVTTCTY